ncbi:MAG: hypothetical protein ABI863_04905 [Ginsengibacter sp.]
MKFFKVFLLSAQILFDAFSYAQSYLPEKNNSEIKVSPRIDIQAYAYMI